MSIFILNYQFCLMSKINPMREVKIEKLIVHSCIGGEGDEVIKAARVLK